MSENTKKTVELPASITIRDLGERIGSSPIQIIKILMNNGVMANINQIIDFDTAAVVCAELNMDAALEIPEISEEEHGEIPLWRKLIEDEAPENLVKRPPVVTILGHVDHGKTTLLDAIRHTNVAGEESGGITQHIGAYQVVHNSRKITFLDTPGHAAFTAMRARGAQGADIVVLVVAANDGVMPQTKEAIAHAKAARVPIIVALNKIDRDDANPDMVKKQLADAGLVSDEWDGDTIIVPVSAKMKMGLEDLLEAITLVADSNTILANPKGKVIGTVIEAKVDKARGVVATLLVQNGTLYLGDAVVVGLSHGKIKAMYDYYGEKIEEAGPATPIQILGLNEVPQAGDLFQVTASDKEARAIVEDRKAKIAEDKQKKKQASLEDIFSRFQAGELRDLRLIIKADVQGSLDPIISTLNDIDQKEIKINVLHAETGNISESDIMLASASNAIVVGFNVEADSSANKLAEAEGISIRLYSIIYRLTEDIEKALKGMLEPEKHEVVLGKAHVLAVFSFSKVGKIAGCKVIEGIIRRNASMRVIRNGQTIFEGEVASLRREKENVRDVREGFECGIRVKGFNDFSEGDILECYTFEEVPAG
ncbi:MAG TPA: translation initiation factor IF-2 [Anaerolineaceae bacterium]|uniref:Translation initiation factor IF-2 n=1 Tax=Anaerolinea thermophila TaxID=167964 RepID=A0A101FXW1_9CHLR|nr:MAG: Translation initiation factor IF-2 [Anaerolinea thermophila]HAF61308.1 translation initiation factor IF-2 [Anaerolineaceae bacterium]